MAARQKKPATAETAAPSQLVIEANPQEGGRFIRNKDGSLTRVTETAGQEVQEIEQPLTEAKE